MVIAPVIASMFLSAVPKVGDLAPNFSVNDTDGKNRTLSALVSQGPVIVAFFPKAFTAG